MPFRRRRRRWDDQPSAAASVLLASDGRARFSPGAIQRAAELAARASGPVAVVAIAKVHGTSLGLPNPGLMPTRAELQERRDWVEDAIATFRRRGVDADGQVATTRRGVRLLAKVARLRGVRAVVIDATAATGVRRAIEGDPGEELRRRLRRHAPDIDVEVIAAAGG